MCYRPATASMCTVGERKEGRRRFLWGQDTLRVRGGGGGYLAPASMQGRWLAGRARNSTPGP